MIITDLFAYQIIELFNSKKINVYEYVTELLKHIKKRESKVRAWAYINEDLIISSAKKIDKKRSKNIHSKIAGIPIGIKDIIDTKDMPTENGSKVCLGRRPKEDSHLVKLLRDEDILIFGKCVTTEYALSAPSKTRNPNDLKCTPGGSSSGSAAAVADKMIPVSIGSQTGGSVLRPASFNGVVGFKPTFGTISRNGMSPISFKLDHPGVYARCIEDIELISKVIMSYDENDFDMNQNFKFISNCDYGNIIDHKFAFIKGPAWEKGDDDMKEAIQEYINNSKLNITEIELPIIFEKAINAHEVIMDAGIYSSLKEIYLNQKNLLHPFTIKRIENGINLIASDYINAIQDAKKMRLEIKKIFSRFDAIITPSAPGEAPKNLLTTGDAVFNGFWTMMGVPTISLPLITGKNNLPIGIQFICDWEKDNKLLSISKLIINQPAQ